MEANTRVNGEVSETNNPGDASTSFNEDARESKKPLDASINGDVNKINKPRRPNSIGNPKCQMSKKGHDKQDFKKEYVGDKPPQRRFSLTSKASRVVPHFRSYKSGMIFIFKFSIILYNQILWLI